MVSRFRYTIYIYSMYGCWSTDWSLKTPIDICFGMMGHFKLYIVFIIFIYITSVCLIQKSIFLKKENIFVDFFLIIYINRLSCYNILISLHTRMKYNSNSWRWNSTMNTFLKLSSNIWATTLSTTSQPPKPQSFLTGPDARKLLNNFWSINTTTQH